MRVADLSKTTHPSLLSWAVVTALLSAVTASGFVFEPYVSLTSQAMLYVLAVVIASYTLLWLPSVVCAIGAVTAFNFFFVPPRWTFSVASHEHLISLLTMLVVALVISQLAAALRRETKTARWNEQRARVLQVLASELSSTSTSTEVLALGQRALDATFEGPNILGRLTPEGQLDLPPGVASSVVDGMLCSMRESAVLGPGTGRWPGLDAWYVPLGNNDTMHGAACIHSVIAADTDGREHAQALCALLAQALWRLNLTSSVLAAQNEAQRQQLQSTFLAAISHDLRTPLAAVVGAASSLQTQRDKLSATEQNRLLASILSEANYLTTITENTLQLLRLANASRDLKKDWESMEEIVGAVLARVRQRDPARRIKSRVPVGLPLIRADPVLLAQLIANLLDNALKYTSETIELVVGALGDEMQVTVKDRGAGIPEAVMARLFEPFSGDDQTGQRGAGLGLAVCRAIATAHGGSLTVRRRKGGGSSFTLSLAVDPQQPQKESP